MASQSDKPRDVVASGNQLSDERLRFVSRTLAAHRTNNMQEITDSGD